jgi:chromosome segregation ATPase
LPRTSLNVPSQRPDVQTGESIIPLPDRGFRSEMERQLLEIQDAFGAFVDDADLQRRDAERRIEDTEHRLRTIERQKQELEDQLREAARQLRILRKSPAVRIARFFSRLNPLRSAPKRIR